MNTSPTNSDSDRPTMPATYGLLDAHSGRGLLPWAWAEERLVAARNYWVGTTRPDGRPHVMPVWGIWLEDGFLFGTDARSRKARNLAENSNIVVHLESGDEVVVLEGIARVEEDDALLQRYAEAYWEKYQIRLDVSDLNTTTFRLTPTLALAWLETDFPGSATRWRFDSA